ncbi:MAG TPA: phosphate propanoyltransferase [Candidatus Fimadaptatus faecigallinarum]|uniref:Phosphate propanoyltransferase n=1 Tax=Candidatus Fimadaptatus faecigallinarum TaxID=2840814 RepID=A0A9D1LR89_9FIRM|nr:phosphate propanoyltransferase [Candidatus Fimadaptatus faecigallinarum]
MKVLVEVSARHVHLTAADFETLFGKGAKLTFKKALSQPGEFLSHERVDVVGPKRTLANVAILGPFRARSQVELAITDCMNIGQKAPIRESGDVDGSAPVKLIGPAGELTLNEGLIVAKRHIHMTPEDAARAGVENKQLVTVSIKTEGRSLCFGDIVARVSTKSALALHLDTDEANAAGIDRLDLYADII